MVFVHQDSVMMLTTSITPTTCVVSYPKQISLDAPLTQPSDHHAKTLRLADHLPTWMLAVLANTTVACTDVPAFLTVL